MPAPASSSPRQPRTETQRRHEPGPVPDPSARPLRRTQIRPLADRWAIDPASRQWVRLRSSMTREIELALGTRPAVRLLYEGPDRMSPWEASALALPRRARAYAREVALMVRGEPVMLARSLSPMHDPVTRVLRRLQQAPLADILFRDPRWRREAAPVPLRWRSDTGVVTGRACLWQRRPTGGNVLVEEFFLAPLARIDAARVDPPGQISS